MNTATMRKGILTHNGLVGLNGHVHQATDHATGGIYLGGIDIGLNTKVGVSLENHCHLFQTGITGTLTNTIDGYFHLTSSIQHTCHGIGGGHTQVVVAMGGKDALTSGKGIYVLIQELDLLAIFIGSTETSGIGDVTYRSTSLTHGLDYTCQILIVGTSGIFCIELHVLHIALCIFHSCYSALDDFFGSTVEFILDMRRAGTYTCMNTSSLGILQCFGCYINIFFHGTCQGTDGGPCHSLTDFNYRIEVARA